MTTLRSTVEIAATPDRVWAALTDFDAFPDWNPFIRRASGELAVGNRIRVTLRLGRRDLRLRPRLTMVDRPRELRWLARWLVPGLFDVDRRFRIEPVGDAACRFTQSETGRGLLAPLVMPLLRTAILRGYHQLDAALKARTEQEG